MGQKSPALLKSNDPILVVLLLHESQYGLMGVGKPDTSKCI